jgi:hypothetical protein
VTRGDVAEVVAGLLAEPASDGLVLDLLGGDTAVTEAIASVLPGTAGNRA